MSADTVTHRPRLDPGTLVLSARGVVKTFQSLDGPLPVLDGIDLDVRSGEILALLGRSGSGKSTLLRCLAGLLAPSSGEIEHRGKRLVGTNPGTSMVFQSFALLPWLTVQDNVEVGLEAAGVPPAERRARAVRAIDLIGLDGFESAFPKELSGGMRQRVGFARALVTEPEVLLMDEPFSALDVLTAENLRGELLELWGSAEFPIDAIVIVTHNIEEAVLLADRIVVLGSNPGRLKAEIVVDLPRPRDRRLAAFDDLVAHIYGIMTGGAVPDDQAPGAVGEAATDAALPDRASLPHASVDGLSGLAEILNETGALPLGELADELGLRVDDLLPLVDALELLAFAAVSEGVIELTHSGATFAGADIQASKTIFADAVLAHAPLVGVIDKALGRSADGALRLGFFADVLRRSFSEDEAQAQLDVAIDWGRYGELYEYDRPHRELRVDPDRAATLAG